MAGRDDGFTLLDVLVSLVVISVAAAIVSSQLSDGRVAARATRQSTDALYAARSVISEIGISKPLQAGRWEGREPDGTSWEIAIDPYFAPPEPERIAAFMVVVTAWSETAGRDAAVSLQTIKTTILHAQ